MPRYHFHTLNGGRRPDQDGLELTDLGAARGEAFRSFGEIVAANERQVWRDGSFQMTVTSDDGLVLFVLDLVLTRSPAASHYD